MNKKQLAFTLIELLVAVGIIGALAGFVMVQMNKANDAAKDSTRKEDIEIIKNALVSYRSEHFDNGPVQATPCEVGTGCSNLDPVLESFLGKIPKDPNGTSYSYQSDNGFDCTLSAILSDGTAYEYDCATEAFVINIAQSGVCGPSDGESFLSEPVSDLCTQGTASSLSGTGPWAWTCSGIHGGSAASCTALYSGLGLACSVTADCGSGTVILKMSDSVNSHASMPNQSNGYAYTLCCTGTGISNSCSSGSHSTVLKLSSLTNAHVQKSTGSTYANSVCLSSSNKTASCGYATDCSTLGINYICLSSITGDTSAHVGACASYSEKVCCSVQ